MVLLPVFVLVGLNFALLLWWPGRAGRRWSRLDQVSGTSRWTAELADPRHPDRQLFQEPVRTCRYCSTPDRAAMPLRHADLFIVVMSWGVRGHALRHTGNFCLTSNDLKERCWRGSPAVLVLLSCGSTSREDSAGYLRARLRAVLEPKVLNDSCCPAVCGHRMIDTIDASASRRAKR